MIPILTEYDPIAQTITVTIFEDGQPPIAATVPSLLPLLAVEPEPVPTVPAYDDDKLYL